MSPVAERLLPTIPAAQASPRRGDGRAGQLARAALRALLGKTHGGTDWEFRADARGKLLATDAIGRPGPAVSISHTRGWIACAVAQRTVGIDVESQRPRDHAAIAEYAFGAAENALVRGTGAAGFYRVWTVREAIAKATGDGLSLVADGRDRAHAGPDEGRWTERCDGGTWLLAHLRPAPTVSAAIAVLAEDNATWADEPFAEIDADHLFDV